MNSATKSPALELMAKQVGWYLHKGKYRDRIRLDIDGNRFVIGDWSWNREHHDRSEYIELEMKRDGVD